MFACTPALCSAALCVVALSCAPNAALAGKAPATLQLTAGARVGIVNQLDPEVTHFHASKQIENSFLKTYPVSWPVNAMLLDAVQERLKQLGLVAVPVGASDELVRSRERCFLDANLAKGLPKECVPLFARLATAQRLSALVVLGPGRNDSTHAGGARHRELPEYLRGWCFVTGEGGPDTLPFLLNLSELLLIDASTQAPRLSDRQWGGNGQSWLGYRAPADLKAIPEQQLGQLQALFGFMLRQQSSALLGHLAVAP
jgi:hypothetical protein